MTPRVPALLFVALASATSLTAEALAEAPRYRMALDASKADHGVQTVSLVQNPAIQRGWVALSAQPVTSYVEGGVIPSAASTPRRFHLSTATEGPARQVLTGPALLPGQEILRLDDKGNPFYIVFDAATIEGTARQFAAQGRHNSTNQDHAVSLAGNVVYESWLVADPANDKAAALGLDVPAGTWMLSVHIPDADYWQNEVVTGNKTGFSIEGLFNTEQLTLSAAPAPAPIPVKMKWYERVMAMLSGVAPDKANELRTALGIATLADGRTVSIDDATKAVTVAGEDGQPGAALPDGEYDLQGGGKLVVTDGKQAGAPDPAAADAPKADNPDAPAAAAPTELPANADMAAVVAAVNDLIKSVSGKTPADAPAGKPVGQALHGVALADLGPKLTELKLDAIELTEGDKLTYNAVTRRLSDKSGALVESGYYAAADGSYFQVSTSQYIWEIDKQTYDMVYGANLAAVKLAETEAKLAQVQGSRPAAGRVLLSTEKTELAAEEAATLPPHRAFLASVRAANKKSE